MNDSGINVEPGTVIALDNVPDGELDRSAQYNDSKAEFSSKSSAEICAEKIDAAFAQICMAKQSPIEIITNLMELYELGGFCQWPTELSQFRPLKLSHFSRVTVGF